MFFSVVKDNAQKKMQSLKEAWGNCKFPCKTIMIKNKPKQNKTLWDQFSSYHSKAEFFSSALAFHFG